MTDVTDRTALAAVRAAVRFVELHGELFHGEIGPLSPTRVAVLAIELSEAFLGREVVEGVPTGRPVVVEPSLEEIRVLVQARRPLS